MFQLENGGKSKIYFTFVTCIAKTSFLLINPTLNINKLTHIEYKQINLKTYRVRYYEPHQQVHLAIHYRFSFPD